MSFFSNLPTFAADFVLLHTELFLGYAICVVFPIPWLNRLIIDLWAKLLSNSPATPTN